MTKKPKKTTAPPEQEWAAYHPEKRKLADLKKNPRNTKLHPPEQIEALRASRKLFGWTMPILVDELDLVIAGHARLEAALLDGLVEGPVIVARGWSEEMKAAYLEADNRLSDLGSWDEAARLRELSWLRDRGFDMKAIGWNDATLAQAFNGPGATNPNAEWTSMPEFNQQDKSAFRSVVVHFKDQAAVDKFAKTIKLPITPKTRFLWYPKIDIETYADKRYTAAK